MRTTDLIKFALNGLKHRKARTFLTVSGVIIGTVCIVLMISIGLSNYQQFQENIMSGQSLTEIRIQHYESMGGGSGSGVVSSGLTDSTIDTIKSMEHVKAASPTMEVYAILRADKYEAQLRLLGVDPAILDMEFDEGQMFAQGSAMPDIVLGAGMLQQFIDPENPPNQYDWEAMEKYRPDIDLLVTEMEMEFGYGNEDPEMPAPKRYRVRIAGIAEKSNSQQNYNAYIDIDTAKQLFMDNRDLAENMGMKLGSYNEATVVVDELENVETVLADIKKMGFEAYSEGEYTQQLQEEQSRQQGQLFAIGLISLLVSAIGIANTMYANILERRRDIGVMKVVGMKIRKIRSLFLAESAMIGGLGGLVGIGISYIVVLVINTGSDQTSFLGMYFYEGMKVSIPFWLALVALGIALLVGVLSGIYPAWRATKMSPLEAMRNS